MIRVTEAEPRCQEISLLALASGPRRPSILQGRRQDTEPLTEKSRGPAESRAGPEDHSGLLIRQCTAFELWRKKYFV